jgi:hypothetical protein
MEYLAMLKRLALPAAPKDAAAAILFESVVFVLISAIPCFRGHGQSVVSLPAP